MARSSRVERLALLVETLEEIYRVDSMNRSELVARAAAGLDAGGDPEIWLALAVLAAELPKRDTVVEARRIRRASGSVAAIEHMLALSTAHDRLTRGRSNSVHVLRGVTVVDVHHTARTGLATGIQRVVRETIKRWVGSRDVVLVGWNDLYSGIRELSKSEKNNALTGSDPAAHHPRGAEVLIPWKSLYFLPELAIEDERTQRVQALAEFSGNRTAVIGFDCVPLTSAETTASGMGAAFSRNLRAVAEMDRLAAISGAAAVEYEGWSRMLSGVGLEGPTIREIILPADVGVPTEAQLAEARTRLTPDALPLLLCVGSHEPRKNHVAVLHAAERLWRAGREFRLVFIGGNAWRSEHFFDELHRLQRAGRPATSITAVSDGLLWSAYRLATASVFPSFNEGFGLPVAESLAAGTPVVTSDYGSMKEIAEAGGGAILVDPRDDLDIARGLEQALFSPEINATLRAEAATRPARSWDDYADELWEFVSGS